MLSAQHTIKATYIYPIILTLFTTFLLPLFATPNIFYRIVCMLILSCVFSLITFKHNIHLSITTLLISYGISFIFYIFCSFITIVIFFSVYKDANTIPYVYADLLVGILQIAFEIFLINNNHIRSGIVLLIKKQKAYIGCIISLLLMLFLSFVTINRNNTSMYMRQISGFITLLFSFFLLYYWRHRIKQTYIENLRRLENLTYENTIADKDKQIKELEANNAYLAQIIHKYRKVIPAMELSVMELLQNNANWDTNTLKSNAQALQVQLEELRAERNNLLDNYQKDMVVTPQSGLHTIDAMIALMEKQAKEQWVRYKTQIDPSIKELALASIKEADLLHLLGDLIENALHAVNESDHKEILIHISKLNGCLLLEVSDSGAAFDIETYQHFGNEPFTSHEADGGSGTGLMEIWKLKKEYKISLYIYEYETDSNVYTKKISFLFDKKNHFLLKTYRDKEVKNALIRGDLHVFPHKND